MREADGDPRPPGGLAVQPTYELSTGTLSIKGDMNSPLDVQFDIETQALIESAKKYGLTDISIDIREVTGMASQYIGALAAVAADIKKRDGELTVHAKGKVAELLRQCGLDRLMQLAID